MPEQSEKSQASVPDGADIAPFQVNEALDLLECYFKQRGTDFDPQAIDLVLTIRRIINSATPSYTSG